MADVNSEAFGFYCRAGDHGRCGLSACSCPHHRSDRPSPLGTWQSVPNSVSTPARVIEAWEAQLVRERMPSELDVARARRAAS